jgi:glycosyltransferase involved in cell wall biosynthesis
MRILYLNPIGALGGAERSLLDMLAALRALEPSWDLHLIAGTHGDLLGEAERLGVRSEVLPLPDDFLVVGAGRGEFGAAFRTAWRALSAEKKLRATAKKLGSRIGEIAPNIIHSNGSRFHLLTRLIGKQPAPVVWHLRDFVGERRWLRLALRWASPAAAVAIASSEAVARDARTVLGRLPVRVILNAIDMERFAPGLAQRDRLDELSGLARAQEGTLRVGLLASYARWKGQDLFLKAAAIVSRDAPELTVRYYLVGGPLFATQGSQFSLGELQELTADLGLAGHVGFAPFQSEPQDVYRALDVVVHASTRPEPFGRTIVEGMACGRAVVASLDGGVPELIRPDVDALGFPPNDAVALASRIVYLLRHRDARQTLGENARHAAMERFSRPRLGLQLREIYAGLDGG